MSRSLALLLLASALAWPALAQEDDEALKRALEYEARQVALVERLAPSVAAVFKGESAGGGGGSGVVIDPRGYVLTNFHVSGTSATLTVGLNDGKQYRARLLGIDPGGDIALLKLMEPYQGPGQTDGMFPAVPLGVSDEVQPGDRVFAMGNPFLLAEDFTPTVTQGVVSGVHRYRDASGSSDLVYGDCIQIDASINPGNSGGPLFSAQGTLLGINGLGGFRPDRGRVNVGVGFAASIDQIKNFLLDLRASQQCYHGTMNATVRDQESADGEESALVVDQIMRNSNAYRAGLRLADRVVRFQGIEVKTQNRLLTVISRLPAGRRVTIEVQRPRDDQQGFLTFSYTFRLEKLFSGPLQGQWTPAPDMLQAETQWILDRYREQGPPREWRLEETVSLADGRTERRVLRVKGRSARLEVGPPGRAVVTVYDAGRGWKLDPTGKEVELTPAERDQLAGTVETLSALIGPGPDAPPGQGGGQGDDETEITFQGGETLITGQAVTELLIVDRAGRRRLVYLDPATHQLCGLAYQDPEKLSDWALEESWERGPAGQLTIRRVDYETGELLEKSAARLVAEPQDAALFQQPEGQ